MLPVVSAVSSQLSAVTPFGQVSVLLALNHFPDLFPAWFSFPVAYFSCVSALGEFFLKKKKNQQQFVQLPKDHQTNQLWNSWWTVSAAGCVLCLSQGGALGEGASQAAFVPFVPRFNVPSASPQHHPGTAALLAQ